MVTGYTMVRFRCTKMIRGQHRVHFPGITTAPKTLILKTTENDEKENRIIALFFFSFSELVR